MPSFMQLWAFIRSVKPVVFMMAAAFAYGAKKYGEGTWRQLTAGEHLEKALTDIVAWKRGTIDKPVLIDAALHVVFAAMIALSVGAQPPEYKK